MAPSRVSTHDRAMSHVPLHPPSTPLPSEAPTRRRRWPLVILPAIALVAVTACGPVFAVEGSGVPETTTIAVDRFDDIDVTGTFDVEIAVAAGPSTVEVTVDDNLVEHLDVEVDGTTLSIGFERGDYDPRVSPRAIVSVPELSGLEVSGASSASVTGVDTDRFTLNISGASLAVVEGTMTHLAVAASGASSAIIEGAVADDVELDASGASYVDLTGATADEVAVDLSGASSASVGPVATIGGVLSGASNLEASPESDVSVRTSGASHVDWD